jgi:hypothetical protein
MELGEYSFLWEESAALIHKEYKEGLHCGLSVPLFAILESVLSSAIELPPASSFP